MGWKLFTLFIVGVSILYKLCQKPPLSSNIDINIEDWTYSQETFQSPILYGTSLKLARILLQVPILSDIITNFIYNKNHYPDLRDFGSALDITPSYLPIRLATDNELKLHKLSSEKHDYKNALKSAESIKAILGPKPPKTNNGFLSIEDIHNAFKTKKTTPYEFAQEALSANKQLSHLNGFISLNTSDVLKQATESTKRWKSGRILSILDGIPIAVKDEVDVKGYSTSYGTSFMSEINGVAENDALIISRLRSLGAIIFGKANMHEIGIGVSGINSHWNTARNPYSKHLLHDTGGSSSGTAAVVASGIVPVGIGTDGGGSIRIPATFQGLVGIKATFNRFPLYAHGWWSVVHIGFLANNIRDAAICYLAVAGYSGHNKQKKYDIINNRNVMSTNPPLHLNAFKRNNGLSDLRIGVYWDWFNNAQTNIVKRSTAMVNTLKTKYGAQIVDIKIPFLNIMSKAHIAIICAELTESETKYIENNMPYHESTLFTLLFCRTMDSIDFLSALKVRSWFMEYMENEIFDKVDMILLPMTGVVAPKYMVEALDSSVSNLEQTTDIIRFASFANLVGLPAFTVPVGYTYIDGDGDEISDGSLFPIGLQLIADHWREDVLFRVGNVIQKEVEVKLPLHRFRHNL